jgi:hypothetical protein
MVMFEANFGEREKRIQNIEQAKRALTGGDD